MRLQSANPPLPANPPLSGAQFRCPTVASRALSCVEGFVLIHCSMDLALDIVQREASQVSHLALPDRKRLVLDLFDADHSGEWDLLELSVADLLSEGRRLRVNRGPDAFLLHRSDNLIAVGKHIVVDGEEAELLGCEPEGEVPGVVLNKDAKEAFHRAKDGTVNHDGPLARLVGPHVLEAKPLREIEVALHGGALPHPPDSILDLDIDLGAVKGPPSLVHLVLPPLPVHGCHQRCLRLVPDLVAANRLLRASGEVDFIV
mmetsp:Transcript_7151/g.16374  ORF Transcript_7151/g.16374 Transcript_7151/m.16374 type:complete len:259 (-) Transcript_7151:1466-2242(-)